MWVTVSCLQAGFPRVSLFDPGCKHRWAFGEPLCNGTMHKVLTSGTPNGACQRRPMLLPNLALWRAASSKAIVGSTLLAVTAGDPSPRRALAHRSHIWI